MKKLLLLGVVAILLSFALVVVSCGAGCPGDGKCSSSNVLGWCGIKATDSTSKSDAEKMSDCAKDIAAGKDCSC
jgi:hypothetical protein